MNYKPLEIGFHKSIQIQMGEKGSPFAYSRMPGLVGKHGESRRVGKNKISVLQLLE